MPPVEHDTTNGTVSINLCVKRHERLKDKNRVHSLFNRTQCVSGPLSRVVLIGQDIELRIVSLVVRSKEVASEVVLFDTGSGDETIQLAEEVGCAVFPYNGDLSPQSVTQFALKSGVEWNGATLFLPISSNWKLSQLPLSVNRAREGWDIHYLYRTGEHEGPQDSVCLSQTVMAHLIAGPRGITELAGLGDESTSDDVSETLRVRFVKSDAPIQLPQRQSLATASRFAQLFYWMLESKHPLLLFGIPGVVLFVLGYRLSGDLATMFTELNSTSIGVTLITVAMTLIGLFSMMVALILYIMGKQVARIQNQYNWPKGS